MARRRRRGRKRSGLGRFVEGMAVLVLLLVILTFGFSIANRFAGAESGSTVPRQVETGFPVPPPSEDLGQDPGYSLPMDRVQLVVENGCGQNGLAREFADEIRGPSFDVVDYRDAAEYDHTSTVILASSQGRQAAQKLLRELQERYGVGEIQMTTETIFGADVRLILGADLADIWNRRMDAR